MLRVGDDAFDGQAVVVAQVFAEELGHILGHVHGLLFQRFAHAAEAAVDGRANADLGHVADQLVGWRICLHEQISLIMGIGD